MVYILFFQYQVSPHSQIYRSQLSIFILPLKLLFGRPMSMAPFPLSRFAVFDWLFDFFFFKTLFFDSWDTIFCFHSFFFFLIFVFLLLLYSSVWPLSIAFSHGFCFSFLGSCTLQGWFQLWPQLSHLCYVFNSVFSLRL